MRILVTNDDGIDAEGLDVLVRYLKASKGKGGADNEINRHRPRG